MSAANRLHMDVILTHNNADFDAAAALLGAHKLYPTAIPILPERQNANVADFVTLYQNGLPFVRWEDFRPQKIKRIILVDVKRLPPISAIKSKTPVHIIDHHPPPPEETPTQRVTFEPVGAITTYFVEQIQAQKIGLTSLEATMLMLGIYSDTGALTYGTTTPRDVRAAAWLLENGAVLDTVRRFLSPGLNVQQQALFEKMVNAAESRSIHGYNVIVCAGQIDTYLEQISSVAHRLRDLYDPAALFLVVAMPNSTMLVCRAAVDGVDVGEIARLFGGGGHGRAAAATIYDLPLDRIVETIWTELSKRVQPTTRVAELMSTGVKTFGAVQKLAAIAVEMRRIGHEGYPVLENGRVVGLLTRRDADRALEHGLTELTAREVMNAGEITIKPDDSVSTLEQLMVSSGWGQIPVVDADERIIGIVTRTDLIKHWARIHPPVTSYKRVIEQTQMETVLGSFVWQMIKLIAREAESSGSLYMVGGAVRDLLLGRRNFDIDFVVEGDAIAFAERLSSTYGGHVSSYRPFGTATWMLDAETARRMGVDIDHIPHHLDFATARNEFYEHPTALPTVYSGSIKLDLARRDFTINTLAVQLNPAYEMGRLLDFFGGERDLQEGLIRVLHSLSFVDDPTRILRAIRFEYRLNFKLEPRTHELMMTALPMLRRITGERVRNELTLLLREESAAKALLKMQERGILAAIHPVFVVDSRLEAFFKQADKTPPVWEMQTPEQSTLRWYLLAAIIPLEHLNAWCERLLMPRTWTETFIQTAKLLQTPGVLATDETRPSAAAALLADVPDIVLYVVWLLADDQRVRENIVQYAREWRYVTIASSGETLIALGETPGPHFGKILRRLRDAHLDGEISSVAEEQAFLKTLLEEERRRHDGSS